MSGSGPLAMRLLAAGLVALAVGGGCASTAEIDSIRREQRRLASQLADTRADVDSLRSSVARLRGSVDESRRGGTSATSDVGSLDQRVAILEERYGRGPASRPVPTPGPFPVDTSSIVDPSMSSPVAATDGNLAPLPGSGQPVPEPAPPGSSAVYGDGAGRPLAPLAAVPAGVGGATGAYPGSASAPAPAPAVPAVGPDGLKSVTVEQDLARGGSEEFTLGLQQYQRGEYPKAVQTLRSYVSKRPGADPSARAQYWIGESYFAQRKYNEAILAFNEIVVNSPKSERVPAALLRQAAAFSELGDKIDARLILQKLTAEHPNTEEAAKAKQKLLALGA